VADVKAQHIERDLKRELAAAGILPDITDLVLLKINRDGITYNEAARSTQGARGAVRAFKNENPKLFGKPYLDGTKSIEEIERERDQAIFGRSAAGHD
jgi:hypothetical protein